MTNKLIPARVPAPGVILSEELEARDWTQKDLAEIMGRPPQTINEIIKGTKQITPETALELSAALDVSAEFWTNLEANYRLHLARKAQTERDISRKSKLYSIAPIAEMTKRGWIKHSKSIDQLEENLCNFLEISSPDQTPKLAANLRCTPDREPELNARVAWAKRVEHIARQQTVGTFDHDKFLAAIPTILSYSQQAEDISKIPNLLTGLGVHFVIVQHLSKTYLDGAAFYLEEHPVIALTLRYDRIDWFWFTLMHEVAHIAAKHQGVYLDNFDEGDINDYEKEANQMARDKLIAPDTMRTFIKQTQPYFSKQAIAKFAESQNRHAGIILGRLQKEDLVSYKNLRSLLVKVSPFLQDWMNH